MSLCSVNTVPAIITSCSFQRTRSLNNVVTDLQVQGMKSLDSSSTSRVTGWQVDQSIDTTHRMHVIVVTLTANVTRWCQIDAKHGAESLRAEIQSKNPCICQPTTSQIMTRLLSLWNCYNRSVLYSQGQLQPRLIDSKALLRTPRPRVDIGNPTTLTTSFFAICLSQYLFNTRIVQIVSASKQCICSINVITEDKCLFKWLAFNIRVTRFHDCIIHNNYVVALCFLVYKCRR